MTTEQQLLWELGADFENEPLEDGIAHRAEETLERRLATEGEYRLLPVLERICLDDSRPALAAGALRCLARLETRPWNPRVRAMLISGAIQSRDVQIRDAGVQAAEHWDGEPEIVEALRRHSDSEEWMQEYIDGILRDWGQTPRLEKQR